MYEHHTTYMEWSFLTSSIFNIMGRHQLIFPDKLFFFSDGISLQIKCEKYCWEPLPQLFWVVMLSKQLDIAIFMSASTVNTLLIASVCYTACNCKLHLPTACHWLLLHSSVFYCLLFVYFWLLQHVISRYYIQVTGCYNILLSASVYICLHLWTPVSVC